MIGMTFDVHMSMIAVSLDLYGLQCNLGQRYVLDKIIGLVRLRLVLNIVDKIRRGNRVGV